jgi:uncharacterized protein (TIGR03663 family)
MASRLHPSARASESPRWLEGILSLEITLDRELVAYLAIMALAFALHFWDLGSRALHHDESLHATYSHYLYKGGGYRHDPLMHGPVLFHLTALMYFLFGVSNATARFAAAFAGTALVFVPYLLRRWLGRWGALSAAILLTFSPAMLYYSRFIREDIFVALWAAGLFAAIWRYTREGRAVWLYAAMAFLALGFANKELTFMLAAIVLVYTNVVLALRLSGPLAQRLAAGGRPVRAMQLAAILLLLPTAWAVAVLWNPLRRARPGLRLPRLPRSGDLLVVTGTLTLPQLSALVQIPLKHFGMDLGAVIGTVTWQPFFDETFTLTRAGVVGAVTIVTLMLVSAGAGLLWNRRRWLIAALVFYSIFICLFTTFFTNPNGLASGIWGSLDYWLQQQNVQRGGQPVFYYLMMLPAYAYVPLLLAAIGVAYRAVRNGLISTILLLCSVALMPLIAAVYGVHSTYAMPLVVACIALAVAALREQPLRQLLVTWFGGLLLGLSVAGEKMPWLTIHLELPLILLAALTVQDALAPVLATTGGRGRRLVTLLGAFALGVAVVVPAAWGPGSDTAHALVIAVTFAGAALAGAVAGFRWSSGMGLAIATAAVLGLILPLSARTAFALSYVHGDTPYEALVYTQTSPDIPKIMNDIQQYSDESGQGHNQQIVVDAADAFSWPWAWYLRDYPQTSYVDLSPYVSGDSSYRPPPGAIMLVNDANRSLMQRFSGQFGAGIPYHHRWWFPEDYRGTTAGSFAASLRQPDTWGRWWGLIAAAHGIALPEAAPLPGVHNIGTADATAYFPADYVPGGGIELAPKIVGPTRTVSNGALILGGSGSLTGSFARPAGLAVDANGDIFVADSQNNRIEEFNPTGALVAASVAAAPFGPLNEPWGVAVDRQGTLYVADTWNHRIVKMDPQLRTIATWGYPTKPTGPDSLLALYGPRAIAFDAAGNLLVTDTGNNRVIEFTPDGKPVASFGSAGSGPGQFQEPVGIAVGADGSIYVADTWNGRVDVFGSDMRFIRSLPVRGWESRDIEDKPYLALLANGDLLVTQPRSNHLVELSSTGSVVRNSNLLGSDLAVSRPIGVAVDGSGSLYVSDGLKNQVIREPLAALP